MSSLRSHRHVSGCARPLSRLQPAVRCFATAALLAGLIGCGGQAPDGSAGDPSNPSTQASEASQVSEASPDSQPAKGVSGQSAETDAAARDAPLLVDATDAWNVDFTHDAGEGGELLFPEMIGGGIAVFDADGDQDLDLYFISGAPDLGRRQIAGGPVNHLFLQGEDGRFSDATKGSGLDDAGYGTGVAVGDFDNDGHEDVFLSNIGADRLFRGRGDGTFEDVSRRAGLPALARPEEQWSTSAAFCDFDRDGNLDLYVVGYVIYDQSIECTDKAGRREYCGPDSFEDRVDTLLHNQGDGTFRDITQQAGIGVVTGAGLGVVCEDFDDDGWVDVYVANDGDPNQLWMNQRDGTFLDDALIMGTSVNAAGLYEAGMGVVAADFDNDADFDIFLTHLRDETNTFYRNLGVGIGFEDQTTRVGLAVASTPYTGFGTAALDADLDGDLDLLIANGRVTRGDPLTDQLAGPWNPYAEPNLAYRNENGEFQLWGQEMAALTAAVDVSRALATGDLDRDGDLDVLVGNIASPVRLYRSKPPANRHWLLVDAVDPRFSRRALGARVVVTAGGQRQLRTLQGAMSYLSSSDPRAHFGFGGSISSVEKVQVRWPDGLEETFTNVGIDRSIVLRRGEGTP